MHDSRITAGPACNKDKEQRQLSEALNEPHARRILAELTEARATRVVSAWGIAVLHASLGDVEETFRWIEVAIEERSSGLIMLRAHPRLDVIRGDRRYAELVRRVGLESTAE